MRRRLGSGGRATLAGAALVLAAGAASGDYRASYEKGIRAIDNASWDGAIEALQAAIQEKSSEGDRVLIYGMRFKFYLPHYYQGLAYFSTGNCRAAMKAWAESESQGAVRKTAEYATLRSLKERCRAQGAGSEKTRGPTLGLLVVDALPWGTIERVEDSAHRNWAGGAKVHTPHALHVPPGRYSILLRNADSSKKQLRLSVEVRRGETATCVGRFEPVDPNAYLEGQGLKR